MQKCTKKSVQTGIRWQSRSTAWVVFEFLTAKMGAVLGDENIDISKKAVIMMCADNGVVAEGISQSGQEVTLAVAKSIGKECFICRTHGNDCRS